MKSALASRLDFKLFYHRSMTEMMARLVSRRHFAEPALSKATTSKASASARHVSRRACLLSGIILLVAIFHHQ